MNISFFGASVTAQKTGYVKFFTDRASFDGQNFKIFSHGYGSMHIMDAGMCFIDSVLNNRPDYCFIDWFSTAYIPIESELIVYLDTFRYKFLPNCQIVFLLLSGSKEHMSTARQTMYRNVKEYAIKYDIPCIDVYEHVKGFTEKDLLRDTVHTLESGSEIYGNFIYKSFIEIMNKRYKFLDTHKTKYSEIKKNAIPHQIIYDHISIIGNAEILGLYQNIGPYSGVVNINADGIESKQHLWDIWCFYEREVLKIRKIFKNQLMINVLQDDFDKSSAKQQVQWSPVKVIKPVGFIYYLGDIVDINFK